jgi:ComF family protein
MKLCLLCHSNCASRLCDDCTALLPLIDHSCKRCGRPLPINASACGQCLQKPPAFDHVIAPFAYQFPITQLCIALKHQHHFTAGFVLAQQLVQRVDFKQFDILLPVPLHRKRLRERGFNQAAYLARIISQLSQVAVDETLIHKKVATQPQVELGATRRRHNLSGVFSAHPFTYKNIAIIDDIFTTGATSDAIATCLKKQSNCTITVVVAARTLF